VLPQAVFGDWFNPIHADDMIFSVAVTHGYLPTLEILSIKSEKIQEIFGGNSSNISRY